MQPAVIENYKKIGVDAGRIVRRILSHLSPDILKGLHEVRLLDRHDHAFACYKKEEGAIEIYIADLLGDFSPTFFEATLSVHLSLHWQGFRA